MVDLMSMCEIRLKVEEHYPCLGQNIIFEIIIMGQDSQRCITIETIHKRYKS